MSIEIILSTNDFNFLNGLLNLLKYSLDKDSNIYIEFILLLNNENIIQAIIDNKKCKLNKKQISFLKQKEINLVTILSLLEDLKAIPDTNNDIINYFEKNKKKSIKKRKILIIQNIK